MSAERDPGNNQEGVEGESQAAAMRDRLSKEVASWSKERRDHSDETIITPTKPIAQRPARRPAGDAGKSTAASSAASVASKPPGGGSKPFSMSYGGMTQAEYIRYLREQGLR